MHRSARDVGSKPEATITRTINDYCSDAEDFSHSRPDLFERKSPAEYRLRSFPNRPDLIEIENARFEDPAYSEAWKEFQSIAQRQVRNRDGRSRREQLIAFSKAVRKGGPLRSMLERYQALSRVSLDDIPD
jgi:hypothetical protein